MDGEAAPARADLHHVIRGRQTKLSADSVVFGDRGLFQCAVLALEYPAGIGECIVQKQLVESVSQVIMGGDILPAAPPGVPSEQVVEPVQGDLEPCQTCIDPAEDILVQQDDPNQRGQVVNGPGARHVGLARPDAAAEGDAGVEAGVVNLDLRNESLARLQASAEDMDTVSVFDDNTSLSKSLEQREKGLLRHSRDATAAGIVKWPGISWDD